MSYYPTPPPPDPGVTRALLVCLLFWAGVGLLISLVTHF
jgi:hypothetical protein